MCILSYRTNRTDTQLDVLCCQQGVYRVNCLDCLDRTNVIQSQICKEMLLSVVSDLVCYSGVNDYSIKVVSLLLE